MRKNSAEYVNLILISQGFTFKLFSTLWNLTFANQ